MNKYLGLDLSISSTGWVAVRESTEQGNIKGRIREAYGKIQTEKKDFESEDERLNSIADSIKNIIEMCHINIVNIEAQHFGRNPKTALQLSKLLGMTARMIYMKDLEVRYYQPSSIRKKILGDGRAKKEDVCDFFREHGFDIGELKDSKSKSKNSDIYDAHLVALM